MSCSGGWAIFSRDGHTTLSGRIENVKQTGFLDYGKEYINKCYMDVEVDIVDWIIFREEARRMFRHLKILLCVSSLPEPPWWRPWRWRCWRGRRRCRRFWVSPAGSGCRAGRAPGGRGWGGWVLGWRRCRGSWCWSQWCAGAVMTVTRATSLLTLDTVLAHNTSLHVT